MTDYKKLLDEYPNDDPLCRCGHFYSKHLHEFDTVFCVICDCNLFTPIVRDGFWSYWIYRLFKKGKR